MREAYISKVFTPHDGFVQVPTVTLIYEDFSASGLEKMKEAFRLDALNKGLINETDEVHLTEFTLVSRLCDLETKVNK